MHSHKGCIGLVFHCCEFSYVFLSCLPEEMRSHIGYTCVTSLGREFSCVPLNFLPIQMKSHRCCIYMFFLQCALSNVSSSYLGQLVHNCIGCICLTSLSVSFPWNCSKFPTKKMRSFWWQMIYCLIFFSKHLFSVLIWESVTFTFLIHKREHLTSVFVSELRGMWLLVSLIHTRDHRGGWEALSCKAGKSDGNDEIDDDNGDDDS